MDDWIAPAIALVLGLLIYGILHAAFKLLPNEEKDKP